MAKADDEREKPLHRGVMFVEINKEGVCRVTGYTGSKEDGDQELIMNVSAKDPARTVRSAEGILQDIVHEMFKVHAESINATPADTKPRQRRGGAK